VFFNRFFADTLLDIKIVDYSESDFSVFIKKIEPNNIFSEILSSYFIEFKAIYKQNHKKSVKKCCRN